MCSTGKRATPDISLDADPASGVSVYDTTAYNGATGWFTVGGTSASAPMVAARASHTGGPVDAAFIYGNGLTVRDITSGNNGAACLVGYDLCTGRGSWADSGAIGTTTTTTSSSTTSTTAATTTSTTTATSTTLGARTVGARSITYATGSGRSLLITVHVENDLNVAVGGASVKISVTRNGASLSTGTGTTNSSGNVTFKINKATSGTYSTSVTNIIASGLVWDGNPLTTSKTI
jgi:hypothetical protein